jgi:hypothetical protein
MSKAVHYTYNEKTHRVFLKNIIEAGYFLHDLQLTVGENLLISGIK